MPRKFAIFALACILSWWPMMAIHELGHILAAILSSGTITHVELLPWAFSRTDVSPNPHPLLTCWAGPITGSLLPLILFFSLRRILRPSISRALAFFSGFCLIADGAYLALGSMDKIGDAGDLLRLGAPPMLLYLFGCVTIPLGFYLWHLATKPSISQPQPSK